VPQCLTCSNSRAGGKVPQCLVAGNANAQQDYWENVYRLQLASYTYRIVGQWRDRVIKFAGWQHPAMERGEICLASLIVVVVVF